MRTNEDYILKEFKKIEDAIPSLSAHQSKLWCLLSLYRTRQCFFLLSALEECKELSCFDDMLSAIWQSLQVAGISTMQKHIDILDGVSYVCAGMYWNEETEEADYLPMDKDKSLAELQEGFHPCHFHNLINAMIEWFSDSVEKKKGERRPGNYAELVLAATFEDYFYDRHPTENLATVTEVVTEVRRIWADYDFLLTHPTQAEILARIEEYKNICVWK